MGAWIDGCRMHGWSKIQNAYVADTDVASKEALYLAPLLAIEEELQ